MDLYHYRKKRNFKKTPEPAGQVTRQYKKKSTKKKRIFAVQKHAASHLHYDFRLELNGVLLSWAVPKGPCLDPSVKRLAIHVEDHPLAYANFEGIIPRGQYGGGTVMLWDEGEWLSDDYPESNYQKGHLSFTLSGKKLKGKWSLVRIRHDDKTWLLIKTDDQYAKPIKQFDVIKAEPYSVSSGLTIEKIAENAEVKKKNKTPISLAKLHLKIKPFPKKMSPQLATLVNQPPMGEGWLHEIKLDGYRLLAFKQADSVKLFVHRHHDWTKKFKRIAAIIQQLPVDNAILDGEVVALDENQHANFQLLQNSLKTSSENLIYYVFDLLYLDNYDLTNLPLIERKKLLTHVLLPNHPILRYSDYIMGSGKEVFAKVCEMKLEGIVSKNIQSIYSQKRSKNWLKSKCIKRQEFVIAGFTQPKRSRKLFGSLLLGAYNTNHELIYHGHVGTGFTLASLKSIYAKLNKIKENHMPFKNKPSIKEQITWVKPKLVCEVEFIQWTADNLLRHPSFKGLRSDKPAISVTKEIAVHVKNVATATKKSNRSEAMSTLKITHPNKLLFQEDKITKADVVDYYELIYQWIIPYLINRPLTLLRCPDNYQDCFYQKHLHNKLPASIYKVAIQEKNEKKDYLYIEDQHGLLALAQMGTLELHPWGSHIQAIEYPNMMTFDLDPAPDIEWKIVVEAALEIKQHLSEFKLKSFVKSTGGKGLHVVVPIKPEYTWEEVKNFSHVFVNFLSLKKPDKYVSKMSKHKRKGKIFIDYLRNQRGATAIAPYSIRARPHAPVATPLDWDELTNHIQDTLFTLRTLPKRLDNLQADPWRNFFKLRQSLHLDKL